MRVSQTFGRQYHTGSPSSGQCEPVRGIHNTQQQSTWTCWHWQLKVIDIKGYRAVDYSFIRHMYCTYDTTTQHAAAHGFGRRVTHATVRVPVFFLVSHMCVCGARMGVLSVLRDGIRIQHRCPWSTRIPGSRQNIHVSKRTRFSLRFLPHGCVTSRGSEIC